MPEQKNIFNEIAKVRMRIYRLQGASFRSKMWVMNRLWMGFSGKEAIRLSFMLDVLALIGAGVVPMVIGRGGVQAVYNLVPALLC